MLAYSQVTTSSNPALKFTKSHEWVKFDPTNKTLKIGISNYAQGQLGEIIHLEFEKVGKKVKEGASVATVESVKVVADIYSPVEGTVKAVNTQAEESPEIINDKPLESWIVEISCTTEPQNLLSEEEYNQLLKGEHKE